jgi:hypothetical protein
MDWKRSDPQERFAGTFFASHVELCGEDIR